ncbi:hypothetical protein EMCRGX_G010312 [Ephydatia muelleri]
MTFACSADDQIITDGQIKCVIVDRSLPVTSVKGIARNCPFQHQNCFQFQSIHPGITYILTLRDYFTKWVEAVALPTKEASGIASSLFKIFMKTGLPACCDHYRPRHHLITAYHPQETEIQQKESQHKALLEDFCSEETEGAV